MPQDRASGAAASEWGRLTAQRLIEELGGTSLSENSNEFLLGGEKLVLKCASASTTSVGVSLKMLDCIDGIVAAFADTDGAFTLSRMSPHAYRARMRPTRSCGASAGKVGKVSKSAFSEHGVALSVIHL
jgi:hypothetical protein